MKLLETFPEFKNIINSFIEICHRLYDKELVCAYDGNISFRKNNVILTTPTHVCKKELTINDLVVVDINGKQLYGSRQVTSEFKMHLAIYHADQDIKCVIHAHPLYATAIFRNMKEVDTSVLMESKETFPVLPVIPKVQHGTSELANLVGQIASKNINACMLDSHGAVVWNDNLEMTYFMMESLERLGKTTFVIHAMK